MRRLFGVEFIDNEEQTMRCKMKITAIINQDDGCHQFCAEPVTYGSEENDTYFKYTPGGSLDLQLLNAKSVEGYKVGDEIYVDIGLA